MADPDMTANNSNNSDQTMQREQVKTEVGGDSDTQREQSVMDKDRQDKSAIGGQSETAKDKSQSEIDKNRSGEPTNRRAATDAM